MKARWLSRNLVIAALYAGVGLILPATPFANLRLTTSLYVLAAWDPLLIPGLAVGNAIAGLPQGPVDMLLGFVVGWLTSWACYQLGTLWAPVAVLLVPTLVVPLWLSWLFAVPCGVVVPSLMIGQSLSAALGMLLLRSRVPGRVVKG